MNLKIVVLSQVSSKQCEISRIKSKILNNCPSKFRWSPINDVEEVQSRSDSVIQGGKRSPFNHHVTLDNDLNGYDNLQNSTTINTIKLRKSKGSNLSTFGPTEDFGGISLNEGKSDVFKRLAMSKAASGFSKENKRSVKKENEINFFDNNYSLPISGKTYKCNNVLFE